jgi:hypothetical protein
MSHLSLREGWVFYLGMENGRCPYLLFAYLLFDFNAFVRVDLYDIGALEYGSTYAGDGMTAPAAPMGLTVQ